MSIATTLAAQHRDGQLQIRARSLAAFAALWPIWTGDQESFQRLVAAAIPLIAVHRSASAAYASTYYQAARLAAGQTSQFNPVVAAAVNEQQITSSLYVTGQVMTGNALAAGQTAEQAMQTALVRTSGAVGRHVLDGGRDTILQSSRADRGSRGWERVVGGGACSFCQMLAGKTGSTEESAGFAAHDHCACSAMPLW